MLNDLAEYLNFEDIFEIKKQVNALNKQGKLLPLRTKFMEEKIKAIKQKQKAPGVTGYIFENPNAAILISLMQMVSAFVAEVLCILTIAGQREVKPCFQFYVSLRIVATIDNIYLGAIQDSTMDKISTGAWQPQIIYKKLKWSDRPIGNKCWFVLLILVKILYKCFYFYFFPFITMMINIASPTCTSIILIDEL